MQSLPTEDSSLSMSRSTSVQTYRNDRHGQCIPETIHRPLQVSCKMLNSGKSKRRCYECNIRKKSSHSYQILPSLKDKCLPQSHAIA